MYTIQLNKSISESTIDLISYDLALQYNKLSNNGGR
jgi:hypothetical protein